MQLEVLLGGRQVSLESVVVGGGAALAVTTVLLFSAARLQRRCERGAGGSAACCVRKVYISVACVELVQLETVSDDTRKE